MQSSVDSDLGTYAKTYGTKMEILLTVTWVPVLRLKVLIESRGLRSLGISGFKMVVITHF